MRKGQAAIEYVTTYGWAILVLLIVLAALFASGILSPSYLVSEECTFGNNLGCDFAIFNEAGSTHLNLNIHNGFPYKIRIKELKMQTQDGFQQFGSFGSEVDLESGATATFKGILEGEPVKEGVIKRFSGNLTYVSCAPELGPDCSTVEHTLTGRVIGKVIPQ
ncbi:MAG: hypothetical protein PHF60_03880 [Candidatus ainarchaeum sp.]|nr:hypothetical protein [Candidatus ainarchaeum sp.]